jgi:hypothetical protein
MRASTVRIILDKRIKVLLKEAALSIAFKTKEATKGYAVVNKIKGTLNRIIIRLIYTLNN